jgi:hypothetical protein
VDLGAERDTIGAEKNSQKTASPIQRTHKATESTIAGSLIRRTIGKDEAEAFPFLQQE